MSSRQYLDALHTNLRMAESSAVDARKLCSDLKDGDASTRYRAALEAGKTDCKEAIPTLVPLLLDGLLRIRKVVVQSLQTLGWQPVNDTERIALAVALEQWDTVIAFGEDAVSVLTQALSTFEPVDQRTVAHALGMIKDKGAVDSLIEALSAKDFLVRKTAAEALGQIGDQNAVAALQKSLEDAFPQVRSAASEALAKLATIS